MTRSVLKINLQFLLLLIMGLFLPSYVGTEKPSTSHNKQDPIRYLHNVFDQVTVQKNVNFGETMTSKGLQQSLLLDIYTPENDSVKNRPVIVWIHGGGFRYGNDKTQSYIVRMARRFARKGYVCVSIDYRVREKPMEDVSGTISDAVEDATKALDWVRKNNKFLGIDVSKIIIGGGSAGGILGSNLCFNDRSAKKDNEGIIGFVNLWGTPGKKWSTLEIDRNDPPTIMVHGTEDQLAPYSNSVSLAERLGANNIQHELVTIEGAGHTPIKHMDQFENKIADFLYTIIY